MSTLEYWGMVSTPVTVIPAKMQWGRYNLFKWFARFITWVIEILLQLGDTKPSKLQAAGTQFPAGLTPAALSTLYSVPYLWSVDARISTELAKAGASPVIHLWSNSVPLFCLATQLSIFREARWNVAPQQLYRALIFPKDPLLYSTWSKAWNAFRIQLCHDLACRNYCLLWNQWWRALLQCIVLCNTIIEEARSCMSSVHAQFQRLLNGTYYYIPLRKLTKTL